jgi:hypothetical protein
MFDGIRVVCARGQNNRKSRRALRFIAWVYCLVLRRQRHRCLSCNSRFYGRLAARILFGLITMATAVSHREPPTGTGLVRALGANFPGQPYGDGAAIDGASDRSLDARPPRLRG